MLLKVSLGVLAISWISIGNATSSSVRFPTDDESDTRGGVGAEERYSDNQASAVVLQPNGAKRLPHFIMPQAPSSQNPFGHINPSGFAEGIILSQPSGRPPNRHYNKPNAKLPEKMKTVQRLPYRVISKPIGQHQTRKPLFAPKGPPPKDTRIHPDVNKLKTKHPHFSKEQDYHHLPKPEGLGLTEKELTKLKGNKYYIKGPHSYTESAYPYKFIPTPPSHEVHQQFDNNFHNDKTIHKEKQGYSGLMHFSPYTHINEHQKYQQEQNKKEDKQNTYQNNKHFVPVQEHTEEATYIKNTESSYTNPHQQSSFYGHNQKKTPQTIDSLFDYINKWSASNKYDNSKYNQFKELSDMEEPNFEKEWLSGSEWVPIHAPAPSNLNENRVQSPYSNFDNAFSASTYTESFSNPSVYANSQQSYPSNMNGYTNMQSPFTASLFSNSLSGQPSTISNIYSRPEHKINAYDLRSQIFHKPEVVMGKRPKSADVNNSHEVSAVFMVKQ